MSKFEVGDRVRAIAASNGWGGVSVGDIGVVTATHLRGGGDGYTVNFDAHKSWNAQDQDLELVTNEGGAPMARKTYKLLKDTPTLKAGGIFQLNDRDEYTLLDSSFDKDKTTSGGGIAAISDRDVVERQPQWFVEVFPVTPQYMTREELDQFEAFKAQKPAKATTRKKAGRPTKAKAA